jgi:hypothetical protein
VKRLTVGLEAEGVLLGIGEGEPFADVFESHAGGEVFGGDVGDDGVGAGEAEGLVVEFYFDVNKAVDV